MSRAIVPPFVRSPYNYDRVAASDESGLYCGDVSLARDSFREESDINTIVRRFHLTGELPSNIRAPLNGDFVDVPDFKTAMNLVRQGQESFDAMPAEVRARFHNDPAEFVEFCSTEGNEAELKKLGLVFEKAPEVAPVPLKVEVVAGSIPAVDAAKAA